MPLAYTAPRRLEELVPSEPDRRSPSQRFADRQNALLASIQRATFELAAMKPEYRRPPFARYLSLSADIQACSAELASMTLAEAA